MQFCSDTLQQARNRSVDGKCSFACMLDLIARQAAHTSFAISSHFEVFAVHFGSVQVCNCMLGGITVKEFSKAKASVLACLPVSLKPACHVASPRLAPPCLSNAGYNQYCCSCQVEGFMLRHQRSTVADLPKHFHRASSRHDREHFRLGGAKWDVANCSSSSEAVIV